MRYRPYSASHEAPWPKVRKDIALQGNRVDAAKNPADQYTAQRRVRLIETPDFHATELRLSPGQYIGWHKHTEIQDTFYVFEGALKISLAAPEEDVVLHAGGTLTIKSGRPHLVENVETTTAAFLLLQGIGKCDFVPSWDNSQNKKTIDPRVDSSLRNSQPV
jgi:quercetin dioxygenase-like cupin family protein